MRGSDPDAALYWLVRMLDGGVDPRYVARRMVRMASEDIGLADPRALRIALDAAEVYERLGSPEGELALAAGGGLPGRRAEVATPSTAAYNAARAFVREDGTRPVPLHLRNAPTRLMKELDYGKRLPLRARRGGRLRGRRALLARRHADAPRFYEPVDARPGAAHRRAAGRAARASTTRRPGRTPSATSEPAGDSRVRRAAASEYPAATGAGACTG